MNKIIVPTGISKEQILKNGYDPTRLDVLADHFERITENEIIHGASWRISHKGRVNPEDRGERTEYRAA